MLINCLAVLTQRKKRPNFRAGNCEREGVSKKDREKSDQMERAVRFPERPLLVELSGVEPLTS
jgi:hypothetical protein